MREIEEIDLVKTAKDAKKYEILTKIFGGPIINLLSIILLIKCAFIIFGNYSISNFPIVSLHLLSNSLKKYFKEKKEEALKEILSLCRNFNLKRRIYSKEDIDKIKVVPGSLRIGEDLSSRNIVPIFKEGNYVIIKNNDFSIICFQANHQDDDVPANKNYDENNQRLTEFYYMEPTDEDIEILMEALPKNKDDIIQLKLAPSYKEIHNEKY